MTDRSSTARRHPAAIGLALCILAAATGPGMAESDVDAAVDQQFETLFGAHEPYRAFFDRLQKAVAADDAETVAQLVDYPLRVRIHGKPVDIAGAPDFRKHYADIMTPALRRAVTRQRYADLFANWQGVSVGDGALWFSGVGDRGDIRIIAING